MRRVAQRILNKELSDSVLLWHENLQEAKVHARGMAVMKRVALRILHKELSDCVLGWRENEIEDKQRLRAEALLKRVGGRMRHKELAMSFSEYLRNFNGDVAAMWE